MTGIDLPPVAVSCGEPAGIGPEIIATARRALGSSLPLFAIGAARHFAPFGAVAEIAAPAEAMRLPGDVLPVLPWRSRATRCRACPTRRRRRA